MNMHWLGRVFGWSDAQSSASPDWGLEHLTRHPATVVDSDELSAELARARRYEHDLAVVVLSASPIDLRPSEKGATPVDSKLPQMVALLTAVALREALRHSDVVCYQAAQNRFVLGLAESDAEDAGHALERLRDQFRSRLRLRVDAGVAHFPHDAFTLDELVTAAAARVTSPPATARLEGEARRNGRRRPESAERGAERGSAGRRA
jgi:hypothetical protein